MVNLGFRNSHNWRAVSPSPADQCVPFIQLLLTELLLCALNAVFCSLSLGADAGHLPIWVPWPVVQKHLEHSKPSWSFMRCFFACFYVGAVTGDIDPNQIRLLYYFYFKVYFLMISWHPSFGENPYPVPNLLYGI